MSPFCFHKKRSQKLKQRRAGLKSLGHPMNGLSTMEEMLSIHQHSAIT